MANWAVVWAAVVVVSVTPAGMAVARRGGATAGSVGMAVGHGMAEAAKGGAAPNVIWEMVTSRALGHTVSSREEVGVAGRGVTSDCFFITASSVSSLPTCA